MSKLIASSHVTLVVGLGLTGVSVARYLRSKGRLFWVADTNPNASVLESFKREFPDVKVITGEFSIESWAGVSDIVLSPGVPRSHPVVAAAIDSGVSVVGDVSLFREEASAPIVAISGSNGKTTVTTMVGELAKHAGIKVKVGGNIGTPCLDLLDPETELYVLELSSFQLESVENLAADVASVLNVSPDHMDRYPNYQAYHFAKQRIYFGAKTVVTNSDDFLTQPPLTANVKQIEFGSREPDLKNYGLRAEDGILYLAHGLKCLMPVSELKLRGTHNHLNALAALAIGNACGFSDEIMIDALRHFTGLEHRCQFVAKLSGVEFYNDSKATNVGATLAALRGMPENIILIAGGDAKGADMAGFGASLPSNVKAVITIGVDGPKIQEACISVVPTEACKSLQDAVYRAAQLAESGDVVLLSPACASMDMFKNYQDRGQQFTQAVEALCSH